MAKNGKKKLTYDQKILIIKVAGGLTVLLLAFSTWFGLIRTGIIQL